MTKEVHNINDLKHSLSNQLNDINNIIFDLTSNKAPLTKEISSHLINSGGKKIRPITLFVTSEIFSKNNDSALYLAGALELIHSATLLHDDVVDNSQLRRGKKTANSIWDNKASILVGDFLFSIAFQLMVKSNNLRALSILAKASSIMADGEVMQLENFSSLDLSITKYIEIISSKTAILFSASTEISAIINNRSQTEISLLADFGNNLGIIFQIIDDILDYTSSNKKFGKEIGNDFFEGKITLPLIIAIDEANQEDKKIIKNLITENQFNQANKQQYFTQIIEIFAKYNIIDKSFDFARKYHYKALQIIDEFIQYCQENNLPINENSIDKLKIILDYALQRKI